MSIYVFDMRKLEDDSFFEECYNNASKTRQKKADESVSHIRKIENIAAAKVIDMAVSEYGFREKDLKYVYGPQGKPYVEGNPFYINISHSGDYAVCLISDRESGIDIQKVEKNRLAVAKRFFAESEYKWIISKENEHDQNEAFYRMWALKESYVKAIGIGTSLAFDKFEIRINADDSAKVFCHGGEMNWEFEEMTMPGYYIACCLQKDKLI